MRFGIDISEFQTGVDYARAVTEGNVEFAVLRAGYSTTKDAEFETHYAGFASKIPLGAYQYSYAKDTGGARREAAAMLRWCGGKQFGLPVFLDMEEGGVAALGKEACTRIALAWCEEMEKAGYRAGIYANANWWRNYLDAKAIGPVSISSHRFPDFSKVSPKSRRYARLSTDGCPENTSTVFSTASV